MAEPDAKLNALPANQGGASPVEGSLHSAPAVEPEWRIGERILDTYVVREVYTSGGMAFVYRVHHLGWGIDLALKSPRPEMIANPADLDDFIQEAETWIKLGLHPHIVSCYFIRLIHGIPRIFIEYVEGGSLADAISDGRLFRGERSQVIERILDTAIQFAWGLHYAHERGLVHQDVKPANVLLTRDGVAKVTDFGMAKMRAVPRAPDSGQPTDGQGDKSVLVDSTGLTPAYCSPEQAAAQPLSRRTDIWSWGVSVLEMFTREKIWVRGQYALGGLETFLDDQAAHRVPLPMPDGLAELLRRCFAFEPEERPRDLRQVADALCEIYAAEVGAPYPRAEPQTETVVADTLNNRAVSMMDIGKDADAAQLFEEAIRAEATHSAAVYNRSLFLWRKARITDQEAVAALQQNQKNLPGSWEPAYFLALLHLERGDCREAVNILKPVQAEYGDLPPVKSLFERARQGVATSGGLVKTLHGANSIVNAVQINSQGTLVISGGNDALVRLWNSASGECIRTLAGHEALVHAVALSPDERYALSGGWDNVVRYWDLIGARCIHVLEGHTAPVQAVAFTPDGRLAVSASADTTLRLWSLQDGREISVLAGHTDTVWSLAVAPDGRTAVSASFDNTLRVWNLETGACLRVIPWTQACTSNLSLTPDGKRVLLAGGDNRLWLVELDSGQPAGSFGSHSGGINAVGVTPNGAWALSGGTDGKLRLWDIATGVCLRTYHAHASSLNAVAICSRRALAATASNDQTIRLWWLSTGNPAPYVTVLPRTSQELTALTAQMEERLKNAEMQMAAGDYPAAMNIVAEARSTPGYAQNPRLVDAWDRIGLKGVREDVRAAWPSRNPISLPSEANALALPVARLVLTGGEDGLLRLWDLSTGELVREMQGHDERIQSIASAQNMRLALTAGADGTLRIWDYQAGECLNVLGGHTSEVNAVDLTPDGRLGLSASNDLTIRLWDIGAGQILRTLSGHSHFVRGAAFVPGAPLALSAAWDKTVCLWDLPSGECLRSFTGHAEVIDALAVSPNGRLAATGGLDHAIFLWDLTHGALQTKLEGLTDPVRALAFSTDSRFLFSAHEDGTVVIWSLADMRQVRSIKAHPTRTNGLAPSLDGRFLVTTGGGAMLKVWRLDWQYRFAPVELDEGGRALLTIWLYQRRPYAADGITRAGRASWEEAELRSLLSELAYRGYGSLPPGEVTAALRKLR